MACCAGDHWFRPVLHRKDVEDPGWQVGEFWSKGDVEQALADVLLWIRPHGSRLRNDFYLDKDVIARLHSKRDVADTCDGNVGHGIIDNYTFGGSCLRMEETS